jgi:2-oxo-3-hexenedioate decarboxylase
MINIGLMATELLGLWRRGEQIEPLTRRAEGLSLKQAYDVADEIRRLRQLRGEKPVGRKIGFTNRVIWKGFGISAPIWAWVYDSTVSDMEAGSSFILQRFPESRIEPELVLHLAHDPSPEMSLEELAACIDWVAPGFELVHSIFPGWKFEAADAVAAFGVHSALFIGQHLDFVGSVLPPFSAELRDGHGRRRVGQSANVLGGPIEALHHLLKELGRDADAPPLRAGEIITTGTLTEAMPATVGDHWTFNVMGLAVEPVQLRLT